MNTSESPGANALQEYTDGLNQFSIASLEAIPRVLHDRSARTAAELEPAIDTTDND